MKLRSALVRYTAAVLLIIVAITHFFLVGTMQISPWKGGGFGMFSTVGNHKMYLLRAYYKDVAKNITIDIPPDLNNDKSNIYFFPSRARISTLKKNLAKKKWWVSGDTLISSNAQKTAGGINIRASNIGVELWQLKFDAKTSILSTSLRLKN